MVVVALTVHFHLLCWRFVLVVLLAQKVMMMLVLMAVVGVVELVKMTLLDEGLEI